MKLKLTEDQYGRLFEQNNTKIYKVLKNIFERWFEITFVYCEGTSYEYDTLIKNKQTNDLYSEYESYDTTKPIDDLVEIISDLTGYNDNLIEEFLEEYIETEFDKKDYYGYNKLNEEQKILTDKIYYLLKKVFESNFDLIISDDMSEQIIVITPKHGDYDDYDNYFSYQDFIDNMRDLTGFNDKIIHAFSDKYTSEELNKLFPENRLTEQEVLNDKTYQVIKKIFERNFTIEYVTYGDAINDEVTYIINLNTGDGYSDSEYNLNDFFDDFGDLTGFNSRTLHAFYDAYLKDEKANNISRVILEEKTDNIYKILKKVFENTYELELDDEYADTWDIKFKGTDDYTMQYIKNIQELTGFNKEIIEEFINTYIDQKIKNKWYKLNEQQTDKSYKILKKYFNRHFDMMRDAYGIYVLYRDKDDEEEDSTDFKFYVDDEGWYGVISDIKANTGFDRKIIRNFIESYADELFNEENNLNEEIKINRTPNLLNVKIIEDKKDIGEITFESEDGIEYTIIDAEIKPEFRNKGFYKKAIIDILKKYPDIKIISVFRSNDADNAWNSLIEKLPPEYKVEKKIHKAENTKEYKLSLNEGLDPSKRYKVIIKYLLEYFEPRIDIDPYDNSEKLIFFYKDDINKEEDYDLYLWDNRTYMVTIISILNKITGYKRDFIYNVIEEYINNTSWDSIRKSMNEEVSDDKIKKLLLKIINNKYKYDDFGLVDKLNGDRVTYNNIVTHLNKVTGYSTRYIYDLVKDYLHNDMDKLHEAEIDADGNLIDFDYEEETDAEFETSNFSFILDKVEYGEVYGDFTFKKIDLRFPIVMKPEGDTYRIGFPDDNIEQDFMGAANHFRLGKEYNQFIRHILNTLLK